MKRWMAIPFVLLATLGMISCGALLPSGEGSLTVQVGEMMGKTLLPDVDMEIDSFDILGEGPDGETFTRTLEAEGSVTITDLGAGVWTVTVNAYNEIGELIGNDEAEVTVAANATSYATMIVVPLTGNGTFEYTLTWPEVAGLENPSVLAWIMDVDTEPVPMEMVVDGLGAYGSVDLPAGYYAFQLALLDGEETVWTGNITAFRIVTGALTSGQSDLTGTELGVTGSLHITVGVDMQNPIDITLTGSADVITTEETLTVGAEYSEGDLEWNNWFLDGQWMEDLDDLEEVTVGPGFGVGKHCLTNIIVKGEVIGSEDYWFDVIEAQGGGEDLFEDFNDGLAQGWVLGNGFAVGNQALWATPQGNGIWRSCYYGDATYGGALVYEATIDASSATYPYDSKGIFIGNGNPVTDGVSDGLYFTIAGNGSTYYSFWVGKGDGYGDWEYWDGWYDYDSLPQATTLKIVADGAGYFTFYINDELVYTLTDTSIGAGYVGVFGYDGDENGDYLPENVFSIDNVSLTQNPITAVMPAANFFKTPRAVKAGDDLTKRVK